MASSVHAAFCALVATAYWTLLGFAIACRLLPRVLAAGSAPVIGWAVHNAVGLPVLTLLGLTSTTVGSVAALAAIGSLSFVLMRRDIGSPDRAATIPLWACLAAAALAVGPAAAIAPKIMADGVQLASPIFDHSKVAMIDAMARLGLPPANPFFGEFGVTGRLAYYYLWYYSAAQLEVSLGVSGWEADIGQTWFSAFSSLTLMMGLAVWLGARSSAAIWVVVMAAAGSLRTTLEMLMGDERYYALLSPPTGFAGWLFQSAWVPQHLTAASCVIVAMLLLSRYAYHRSFALLLTFLFVVVAGFESSTHIGGVTFAVAAVAAVPVLIMHVERNQRLRFAFGVSVAATLVACLAAPLLFDQIVSVGLREGGAPIVMHNFEVLGYAFQGDFGRILDFPAYWLVLLPIEFPAIYAAGLVALAAMLRAGPPRTETRYATVAIASLAAASFGVSWLLVSKVGDVNDLGLRAVLPGVMVLISCAAAGIAIRLERREFAVAAVAMAGLVLSLPETVDLISSNVVGRSPVASGREFAKTPDLWEAVRLHAGPRQRVGNNPLSLADMTPWPVNISWALSASRCSSRIFPAWCPTSRIAAPTSCSIQTAPFSMSATGGR
jgi:hypothetical protein